MNNKPGVWQGMRLALFGKAKGMANFFSISQHNLSRKACNAFLNMRVVAGNRLDFKVSDQNAVLTIPTTVSSTPPSDTSHPFKMTQTLPGDAGGWLNIQVSPGYFQVQPLPARAGSLQFVQTYGPGNIPNFDTDISLPSGQAFIAIILDASDPDNPFIGYSTSTVVNSPSSLIIGYANTTDTANFIVTFKQYVTSGVILVCDKNLDAANPLIPTIEPYDLENPLAYSVGQSIVQGITATGFPSNGLYLFVGAGVGVGPNSAWFKA